MKKMIGPALLACILLASATFVSNNSKHFEITKNLEIFTNLYREVNFNYVDELDPAHLMRYGIDAMLESLDPYTRYVSESQVENYRFQNLGAYNGIGAKVRMANGYVSLDETYEDSPVINAGLLPGDQILEVDGRSAVGRSAEEVEAILRGAPGTQVQLKLLRPTTGKSISATITREELRIPNVPYSGMVNDDVGYVILTTFTHNAGRNVLNAIKQLKSDNPELKGMILDLRGNGGGLLSEAVNICNIFLPKGEEVVSIRGKVKDENRSFRTLNDPEDLDIPVTVLVDKQSASASEIVAGVIQDMDRGVLVGQRSYGKGLVQKTSNPGYNSQVRITIAKYYIPSGRCIQAVEYKDGEPVDIPDSLRARFKTRAGRTVLDGGGVRPDIELAELKPSPVLQQLISQNIIYNYVTNYCHNYQEIASPGQFRFDQYPDFLKFVMEEDFVYEDPMQDRLNKLARTAEDEGKDYLQDNLTEMRNEVEEMTSDILQTKKDEIVRYLEDQIISRKFFLKGKFEQRLKTDREIERAADVLLDPKEYHAILGN